jgi:hypothetical protein
VTGLDVEVLPDLEKGFDSLDIARHLYRVAKKDTTYVQEFKKLKS